MTSWTPGVKSGESWNPSGESWDPIKSEKISGKSWNPILEEPIVDEFPFVKKHKITGFIEVERDNKIVELDHFCQWKSGKHVKKYVDLFDVGVDPESIGGICSLCGKWKQKYRDNNIVPARRITLKVIKTKEIKPKIIKPKEI